MEVRCRDFVGKTAIQLLPATGTTGVRLQRAVKELVEKREKASCLFWLQKKGNVRARHPSRIRCREWQKDVLGKSLAHLGMYWRGRNISNHLTTLHLAISEPEEVQQAEGRAANTTLNLCIE